MVERTSAGNGLIQSLTDDFLHVPANVANFIDGREYGLDLRGICVGGKFV